MVLRKYNKMRRKVDEYTSARLAQSVEHETLNLGVVGSSPTVGESFFLNSPFCYFYGW